MNRLTGLYLVPVFLVLGVIACNLCPIFPQPGGEPPTAPPAEPRTEAATEPPTLAGPSLGDRRTRPADGTVMVYVPAGEFEMGSGDAEVAYGLDLCNTFYDGGCALESFQHEQPPHPVVLEGFWIDRTEVANAQYRQCVDAGVCRPPTLCDWGSPTYEDASSGNHPVVCTSWEDAQTYCQWAEARLPTEAEWEYAARGPEGSRYPWGDEPDGTRLNYADVSFDAAWADEACDDGYAGTAPVGSYVDGASWCGALEMAGNVSEWVADWYGDYASGRKVDPTGPPSGETRVVRGGSWYSAVSLARGAARSMFHPLNSLDFVGFRCARDTW